MSAQELARLAPADDDVELRRLLDTEGLQRGDRKARASAAAAAAASPTTSAPRKPATTANRRTKARSRQATASSAAPGSSLNLPATSVSQVSPSLDPPNSGKSTASTAPSHIDKFSTAQASPTKMSLPRRGAPRSGPRGGSDDNGVNRVEIADEIRKALSVIADGEKKAKLLKDKIILLEQRMRKKKDEGLGVPVADHTELEALYRESVKLAEDQRARASDESLLTRIQLLRDLQKNFEQEEALQSARNSSSRTSGMDLDGPSDSPVPSPADNRHVRKMGGSRTSSQPPRSNTDKLDGTASEVSERAGKPKIMYSLKEEVAFKRKLPSSKPEDQDWIQGEVVRVIGEGKSRRYDVKDIDPDAVGGSNIYKSSASQMVPIPPEGAHLGDYEAGKQVLALYPAATTFYRAQVKSMVEGGARVLVMFEEEDVEKSIARRFVLDHKG